MDLKRAVDNILLRPTFIIAAIDKAVAFYTSVFDWVVIFDRVRAAALAFWNSPEYAEVRRLREGTGTFQVVLPDI